MPAAALSLSFSSSAGAAHVPFLRRHLRAAHRILRPPVREISVALVGDRRMSRLHHQFMGLGGPTDVLTFPLDRDARGRAVAGEVVVCVPEARRRAKAEGVPLERELLLYALHGLLHLCGYDDRTASAYRTMHRTEDQILTRLGVGPVFSPAGAGGDRRGARDAGRNPRRRTGQAASGGAR
jgi:probable rRNA maturation factor